MLNFIILLIGFILLIKGADLFVEGASSIARKLNIPAMIIGLTIVAMGTSAPEASVSITSSLAGQNDMSIANVVGSNFFNILVVLGASSLISTLPIDSSTIKKDMPFLIGISILILLFLSDLYLSQVEGVLLLIIFTLFLYNLIKSSKSSSLEAFTLDDTTISIESISDYDTSSDIITSEDTSIVKTILISIVGIVGIVFGGDLVVKSASDIASLFGMSDNLIGLTIVAVGTSLPEFVTSVMAVKKGENEIAIGNVVGSNIFNILFITILLYLFAKKNNSITKKHGLFFLVLYVVYMAYTILR